VPTVIEFVVSAAFDLAAAIGMSTVLLFCQLLVFLIANVIVFPIIFSTSCIWCIGFCDEKMVYTVNRSHSSVQCRSYSIFTIKVLQATTITGSFVTKDW